MAGYFIFKKKIDFVNIYHIHFYQIINVIIFFVITYIITALSTGFVIAVRLFSAELPIASS